MKIVLSEVALSEICYLFLDFSSPEPKAHR